MRIAVHYVEVIGFCRRRLFPGITPHNLPVAGFIQQSDQFISGSFRQAEIQFHERSVLNAQDFGPDFGDFPTHKSFIGVSCVAIQGSRSDDLDLIGI